MGKWRGSKSSLGKIKINADAREEILKRVQEAYGQVVAAIDVEFEKVIEDPNEFADQGFIDHDIVDTGRLRDSQKVNVATSDGKVSAYWEFDPVSPENGYHYATAVYLGFNAFGDPGRFIPGRHFPERGIKRVNPVKMFAAELRKQGLSAKVKTNNNSLLE